MKPTFNLTTEPWIKVIAADTYQPQTVSLIELFQNAQNYRQLAGEMHSQDLAILRLLLAILTTVYSRFNANDEVYDWLIVDEETMQLVKMDDEDDYQEFGKEDLLATWQKLYESGHFTDIVVQYLNHYQDRFDLLGERPFYQVNRTEYDSLVPKEKQISVEKPKGVVGVKQINRRISESGNSIFLFSPKAGTAKDDLSMDELARWLITYQNFAGKTDKTKIISEEKVTDPLGWLYGLNSVYANGKTVFETLMLNLILFNQDEDSNVYHNQKPVWEFKTNLDYIENRRSKLLPDNLAELYTTWARILHVEWDAKDKPIIFSAAIPMFDNVDAFIEPMTTWRYDKKIKSYKPAFRWQSSLNRAMWRDFGNYVRTSASANGDDNQEAGIVEWLRELQLNQQIISKKTKIVLATANMINDGNASSQLPAAEVYDEMRINADVLFDEQRANRWPKRIEEVIEITQQVGKDYEYFIKDIARIRNLKQSGETDRMIYQFYDRLNKPFTDWLASLSNQDDRDKRIMEWKRTLYRIVKIAADEVEQTNSIRDMVGIKDQTKSGETKFINIFSSKSNLIKFVNIHLDLQTKGD